MIVDLSLLKLYDNVTNRHRQTYRWSDGQKNGQLRWYLLSHGEKSDT